MVQKKVYPGAAANAKRPPRKAFTFSIGGQDRPVAVVTGGGSGIGATIARDLAVEGLDVHILGRTESKLERTKAQTKEEYSEARVACHVCDVSVQRQVSATFNKIMREYGPIAYLVNNAAVNPSRTKILDTSTKDWNYTQNVNLKGPFLCTKFAAKQMAENGGGSIVNISSVSGLAASPKRVAYNVSKFGLIGLTQSVALDYAKEGIRCNAVCPGFVETEMTSTLFRMVGMEKIASLFPVGRIGETSEISNAVLFLLSDNASFITGIAMPVDGGYLLKN